MLHNYTGIDLDTLEDLNKLLSDPCNQLGHASTITIQRKSTFCMQRTYPLNCLAMALILVKCLIWISEMHYYGLYKKKCPWRPKQDGKLTHALVL